MHTISPYVKCTGVLDERIQAWKASRPKFSDENLHLDEIGKMDLSLNSMRIYTFEIRSSALFRDLVFALRPICGWALSIRSMPINRETLRTSAEFSHMPDDDLQIDKMLQFLDEGGERDNVRGMLRMSISTVYTVNLDQRVLFGFLKSLRILNEDLFNVYGFLFLDAINGRNDFESCTYTPVHDFYMINQKERGVSHSTSLGRERLEYAGGMIFGYYDMKIAMASQFLRQHYSKVKIGFWNMIPDYFELSISQSDSVEVAFYIDEQSYSRLMSLRSHWVIDWSMDMWGGLCSDFIKDMSTEEFWNFIPNGGGKEDPYFADVYNRVIGEDPGLPCPIMCEWPAMLDEKFKQVGASLLLDKYQDLFAEGFVKDNPKNKHRLTYLKMLEDIK